MILLEGKSASEAIKQDLAQRVAVHVAGGGKKPHLAAILVGENGASETYVANKVKSCAEVGFESSLIRFPITSSESELIAEIHRLNADDTVDGILVQLPLPPQIQEAKIIETIAPEKDVDGFHPMSAGRLMTGQPGFVPATPLGIQLLLQHYKIATSGKHAVVIGRSNIVGRPMSVLLSAAADTGNCTVTLCHSKTPNLSDFTRQADIIVAALGKPGFVHADMIKPGAVVIDVGITRVPDPSKKSGFRIAGDVDFDAVAPLASAITPVPGGVGMMTIAALLENTWKACINRGKSASQA